MIGIRRSHCIPHEAIDLQIGFSDDRAVPFEPGGGLAEPAGQALAGFICKGLSKAEQGNQIGVRRSTPSRAFTTRQPPSNPRQPEKLCKMLFPGGPDFRTRRGRRTARPKAG